MLKEQGFALDQGVDKAEKQLKMLHNVMENAGDINMTSIEEYEKCKVRYDFLKLQVDDLSHSKEDLVKIIDQLDSESRKIFKVDLCNIPHQFSEKF